MRSVSVVRMLSSSFPPGCFPSRPSLASLSPPSHEPSLALTLRSKRDRDSVGEYVYPLEHGCPSLVGELDLLVGRIRPRRQRGGRLDRRRRPAERETGEGRQSVHSDQGRNGARFDVRLLVVVVGGTRWTERNLLERGRFGGARTGQPEPARPGLGIVNHHHRINQKTRLRLVSSPSLSLLW